MILLNMTSLAWISIIFYLFHLNSMSTLKILSSVTIRDTFKMPITQKYITLRGKDLEVIEDNAFTNYKDLESLDLGENLLQRLPEKLFINNGKLMVINLANNKLLQVPDDLLKYSPRMTRLFLDQNLIKSIPQTFLQDASKLEKFNIRQNYLTINCNQWPTEIKSDICQKKKEEDGQLPLQDYPCLLQNLIAEGYTPVNKNKEKSFYSRGSNITIKCKTETSSDIEIPVHCESGVWNLTNQSFCQRKPPKLSRTSDSSSYIIIACVVIFAIASTTVIIIFAIVCNRKPAMSTEVEVQLGEGFYEYAPVSPGEMKPNRFDLVSGVYSEAGDEDTSSKAATLKSQYFK